MILVLGWYHQHNIGDEAFKPALTNLLGECKFVNQIPLNVNSYDGLVIGGGSFLDEPLNSLIKLKDIKIPIGFMGVGIHEVHEEVKPWLDQANVIITRNKTEHIYALDLLYSRKFLAPSPIGNHILILSNGFVVPQRNDPVWKKTAWDWYLSSMGEILNKFILKDWTISLQPMNAFPGGIRSSHDDRITAVSLLTQIDKKTIKDQLKITVGMRALSENELLNEIGHANLVISSRYHGCVLSSMLKKPFVGISFHDKMQSYFNDNGWDNWVDYYGITWRKLDEALSKVPSMEEMKKVQEAGYKRWQELRDTIRERLYISEQKFPIISPLF